MTGVLVLLLNIYCDWYDSYAGGLAHTRTHTSNIQVDWYTGIVTDLTFVYKMVTNFFCLYLCHKLILFIEASLPYFVYNTSHFLFIELDHYKRSHQCPRGGERLAGRYIAEERLRRRLRLSRLEVRGRLVGASHVGG